MQTNMIANPGMEIGEDGTVAHWIPRGSACHDDMGIPGERPHACIDNPLRGEMFGAWYQWIAVAPGQTYRVRALVRRAIVPELRDQVRFRCVIEQHADHAVTSSGDVPMSQASRERLGGYNLSYIDGKDMHAPLYGIDAMFGHCFHHVATTPDTRWLRLEYYVLGPGIKLWIREVDMLAGDVSGVDARHAGIATGAEKR